MMTEYENNRRRQVSRMRSVSDFTMGIIFSLIGIYFLVYRSLRWHFLNQEYSDRDYFLGALCLCYGLWRIYRGYKKNYFKNEESDV